MRKRIFCVTLVFCLAICNLSFTSGGENVPKNNISKNSKSFGKITKYTAVGLCAFYSAKGVKKTVESAKLLMPMGTDFKLIDLLKFPFRLLVFPFKAIGVAKCFLMAGGFGSLAYVLHKIGL
ncbi:hypothetical protein ACFLYU_01975 [Candidatus Dependentiae bacterium]